MLNPWIILGGAVASAALYGVGLQQGRTMGINSQKVLSQGQFDKVNKDLSTQKAEAALKLKVLYDQRDADQAAHDDVKQKLEIARVKQQTEISALRVKYSSSVLRYPTPKQGAGCGLSSVSSASSQADSPDAASPTLSQLPDAITRDLRQLTVDADELSANYRACYDYINPVK
jgi:hypothetical protein